ncbi:hypothetical protein D3C81_1422150 [compost metagenome]
MIQGLTGFEQLLPGRRLLNPRSGQHRFVVPDAGKPRANRNTCPRLTVFRAHHAQNAVVERVFTDSANRGADGIAVEQLFFVHHFGVVVTDFNHLGQSACTGQRNHLGVIGILFHRNLFYLDGRVVFLEAFNKLSDYRLALLLHRRVHEFNGDYFIVVIPTA